MRNWLAVPLLALSLLSPAQAGPAPDFSGKLLNGSRFQLREAIGKRPIIVDFWATWCAPCVKALKKLQAIHETRPDVLVLAISIDDASSMAKVGQLIQGKGYTFPVLLDPDSAILRLYNPSLEVPCTFIIDRQGGLAYSHSGYVPGDEKALLERLDALK